MEPDSPRAILGIIPVMRRMPRLTYLLPLILLLWACYAWIRSYLPEDISFHSYNGNIAMIFATAGGGKQTQEAGVVWAVDRARTSASRSGNSWHLLGVEGADLMPQAFVGVLLIPYPYLLVPLAALSILGWLKYRQQRALDTPGHCQT